MPTDSPHQTEPGDPGTPEQPTLADTVHTVRVVTTVTVFDSDDNRVKTVAAKINLTGTAGPRTLARNGLEIVNQEMRDIILKSED